MAIIVSKIPNKLTNKQRQDFRLFLGQEVFIKSIIDEDKKCINKKIYMPFNRHIYYNKNINSKKISDRHYVLFYK